MGRQRGVLLADAAFVAVSAVTAIVANGWLSAQLGVSRLAVVALAGAMLLYAVQLWYGATQAAPVRRFLLVALVGDVAWIAASVVLLLANGLEMTGTGVVLVVGLTSIVTGFGIAEWRAVRPELVGAHR